MKKLIIIIPVLVLILASCDLPKQRKYLPPEKIEETRKEIKVTKSVYVPEDGASPIAGIAPAEEPDRVLTFSEIGEKYEVKNGEEVNIIYDGVDPEDTYIIYESTFDGYSLELAYRNEQIGIEFKKLCQIFIVANPVLTALSIPPELKYEQIIWTPRSDGTWEVRIGTTERGCKSSALGELKKIRTPEYESKIPK